MLAWKKYMIFINIRTAYQCVSLFSYIYYWDIHVFALLTFIFRCIDMGITQFIIFYFSTSTRSMSYNSGDLQYAHIVFRNIASLFNKNLI